MEGKWIWNKSEYTKDDYSEFIEKFYSNGKNTRIRISSDTNYAVYLNGKFMDAGQYATYPKCPVYDEFGLDTVEGENELRILSYYLGSDAFSTYAIDVPGIVYDIIEDDKVIRSSSKGTLSRRPPYFKHNQCSIITPQLSYRFFYDAREENNMDGFDSSIEMDKSRNFKLRENKKVLNLPEIKSTIVKQDDNMVLVDLEREQTGFIKLDFNSPIEQKMIVSFGEHIVDGGVRRLIGPRDFSFEYLARKGENHFFNPLRRLGLRYIEIHMEKMVDIEYIGLIPTVYPFEIKNYRIDDSLRQKIYDTSVYTLVMCYHEHYEDCPWREQSFYAFDSRNQMLTGYQCFKNREQVRSALNLILEDDREDGLLSLCFPDNMLLTIPSFSLHFFKAIEEYYIYTKDRELVLRAYRKLKTILDVFLKNMEDDMVLNFGKDYHWNFYEWVEHLDYPKVKRDVILNSLFIMALESMQKLSDELDMKDDYRDLIDKCRAASRKEFYDEKKGLFIFSKDDEFISSLSNSLAVLSGISDTETSKRIMREIADGDDRYHEMTLSMKGFMYDAMLKVDGKYREWILRDIDRTYSKMLNNQATTFFETGLGESDFDGAGSLCHGWSALPIYYYHLFGIGKESDI